MKITLKFILVIAIIATVPIFFNSCQKGTENKTAADKELQNRIAKTKDWLKTQPKMQIHPVNEQLRSYHVDEHGNEITVSTLKTNSSAPGCAPYGFPNGSLNYYNISDPGCPNTSYFQVSAQFKISSQNAIVNTNPNNSSQHTYGRIIISNASNTIIFSKQDIPVTITDNGVDTNNPDNHNYLINMVTTSLPVADVNTSYKMRLGLYYYSECPEEILYPYATLTSWYNMTSSVCDIASPVYINPQIHSLSGVVACTCCNPAIVPTSQKILFTRIGFSYTKQLGPTDIYFPTPAELPLGYPYNVEFWNVGPNGCEGPHFLTSTNW